MRNYLKLCVVVGVLLLTGCQSRQPANVKHVSLQIFEVIDCKTSGAKPMSLKGDAGKYCLAAKPVIDETDVRGGAGKPRRIWRPSSICTSRSRPGNA